MVKIIDFSPKPSKDNSIAPFHKEKHFKRTLATFAHTSRGIFPVVELRYYWPGGDYWYCCVWVRGQDGFFAEAGASTDGYEAEAGRIALQKLGVRFELGREPNDIDTTIETMELLARRMGYTPLHTFNAHA